LGFCDYLTLLSISLKKECFACFISMCAKIYVQFSLFYNFRPVFQNLTFPSQGEINIFATFPQTFRKQSTLNIKIFCTYLVVIFCDILLNKKNIYNVCHKLFFIEVNMSFCPIKECSVDNVNVIG
jgi:hypothetical protein